MAVQFTSKVTRRLSSRGKTGSPSLAFTPPISAKNTPERLTHWPSTGSVFASSDEKCIKSPRIRLFKNLLQANSSVTKDNIARYEINSPNDVHKFDGSRRACQNVSIGDKGFGSAARNSLMFEYLHPTQLKGETNRVQTAVLSSEGASPTIREVAACKTLHRSLSVNKLRYQKPSSITNSPPAVKISKITLTPGVASRQRLPLHCAENDSSPTNSSFLDEDAVYFNTPFRDELARKGLDGLDFKPCVLGRGGFGVVVSASYGEMPVAVKMITKNNRRRLSIEISIQNEENGLDLSHHPNVVQTYGIYDIGDDHSVVIMEYAGAVHLASILENPSETITNVRRLSFVCQIADAINWCHMHQIVHLDVKPANIIIGKNDHCKLGDFGCSRHLSQVSYMDDGHESQLLGGTIAYRAPELLQGRRPTFKADIYSLGITMWQILSREIPYRGLDPHVIIYKVVTCDTRPDHNDPIRVDTFETESYVVLCRRLWLRQENERPNIDQVVERLLSMASYSSTDN